MKKINSSIIVCVILAMVALCLKYFCVPGFGLLSTVSLVVASCLCVVATVKKAKGPECVWSDVCAYISMTFGFVSILFIIQHYGFGWIPSIIAAVAIVTGLLFLLLNHPIKVSKTLVCAALVCIVSCISFIPARTMQKITVEYLAFEQHFSNEYFSCQYPSYFKIENSDLDAEESICLFSFIDEENNKALCAIAVFKNDDTVYNLTDDELNQQLIEMYANQHTFDVSSINTDHVVLGNEDAIHTRLVDFANLNLEFDMYIVRKKEMIFTVCTCATTDLLKSKVQAIAQSIEFK